MKKLFNWPLFIVITTYIVILALLIVGVLLDPNPRYSVWAFIAIVWAIPGFLLPCVAYRFLLQATLFAAKEHAVVVQKTAEEHRLYRGSYTTTIEIPVLVARLDTGEQITARVSHRLYNSLRSGDTGMLTYKRGKGYTFIINFERD